MTLSGDPDAAIDFLDQLYSVPNVRAEALRWAELDNDLDPLRTNPRFIAVMENARAMIASVSAQTSDT